jgi:hypothetical protein
MRLPPKNIGSTASTTASRRHDLSKITRARAIFIWQSESYGMIDPRPTRSSEALAVTFLVPQS